ncbi:hypothetical protein TRVL_08608 [Trypanosoma vivax]|nr:hypothetical protein TRVL_08608 [Trypanosoma vivax]
MKRARPTEGRKTETNTGQSVEAGQTEAVRSCATGRIHREARRVREKQQADQASSHCAGEQADDGPATRAGTNTCDIRRAKGHARDRTRKQGGRRKDNGTAE